MILALALACHTRWDESADGELRVLSWSGAASPEGTKVVDAEVLDGETSLILSSDTGSAAITFFSRIWDPSGELVFQGDAFWDDPHNRTTAPFADTTSVLLWPLDAAAPPLESGRWRFEVRTDERFGALDLAVVLKADADPDAGVVPVDLMVPDGLDADWLDAVERALVHWEDDIAAPAGMGLDVEVVAVDAPTALSGPGGDDAATWAALAAARAQDRVGVMLLADILDAPGVLGLAGNIPGALAPTGSSGVAIDLAEGAGRDGRYDDSEIDLLGETLAHEVGHYLGLFHPIELPTARAVESWDALDDTPECTDFDRCVEQLAANLMFPAPVCGTPCVTFVPQVELSPLQAATAHSYPALR